MNISNPTFFSTFAFLHPILYTIISSKFLELPTSTPRSKLFLQFHILTLSLFIKSYFSPPIGLIFSVSFFFGLVSCISAFIKFYFNYMHRIVVVKGYWKLKRM